MANDLTVNQTPEGYFAAYCNRCGRHVDKVSWEWPMMTGYDSDGIMGSRPTGEVVVTIECHGEIFSASNRRGEIKMHSRS